MMRNDRIRLAGSPAVDLTAAETFLTALDPQVIAFSFATYDDVILPNGKKRRLRALTNNSIHSPLPQAAGRLQRLNARGAGIFVMLNAGDGMGRADAHVKAVRAAFQDDDAGLDCDYPLSPSLIVETSPGRFQRFWLCKGLAFADYHAVERCLAHQYGHDPNATALSQVVRLPGFLHMKQTPHRVDLIGGTRKVYDQSDLIAAFPSPSPINRPIRRPENGNIPSIAHSPGWAEIKAALAYIPADDRGTWLKVGMALHAHARGSEAGYAVWGRWSQSAPDKYDPDNQLRTWQSFKGSGLTLASLFALAREHRADLSELARTHRHSNRAPAQSTRGMRTTKNFARFMQAARVRHVSSKGKI